MDRSSREAEIICFASAADVDCTFAYELMACKHGGIIDKEGWAINTNMHKFSELSLE